MPPKVSVVIATHNHAHFLPECLASVKSQIYQDYEVIVVNNGSTDNTEEVVKKLAWDKLRYHYQNDTGSVAGPRNTGIKLAQGEYVAFLDSDDLWFANKLDRVMRTFIENSGIDIISHDMLIFINDKPNVNIIGRVGPLNPDMFKQLLTVRNGLIGSATVLAKKVLNKIGGFDESKDCVHAEDYEAWLKIAYQGYKFHFINEILGKCRVHDSNLSYDYNLVCKNWINVLNKYYKVFNGQKSIRKFISRNKSIGTVYFVTAVKYYSQRQHLKCLISIIMSFLLSPINVFNMICRRALEKRSGIVGSLGRGKSEET